ncbi:MAG: hypothetical protein L3J74_06100 [Bacteroidales bacterium]|nr:hypothetical protein [Bacteroidales bacterium]
MKRKLLTFGIAAAFLIGASLITACGNSENTENHEQHEHMEGEEHMEGDEHNEMDHEKMNMNDDKDSDQTAEATYACPMHPEVTGKEGDKCSKCGMALVKVEEDHSEHNHE